MARKIQHKRGLEANLPQLDVAEIAFTTDSKKPFIGSADGNIEIAKKKDVDEALANKANATTVQGLSQTVNAKADVEYVEAELAKKADTTALETKADVTALETKADKEEVTTLSAQLADTAQTTGMDFVKLLRNHNKVPNDIYVKKLGDRSLEVAIPYNGDMCGYYLIEKDMNDDYVKLKEGSVQSVKVAENIYMKKNYDTKTGSWITSASPNIYTRVVGDTFSFSFEGTGFVFNHYGDTRGGMWEFNIDNGAHIVSVSVWRQTAGSYSTEVIKGLADGTHNVVATFRGADPNNPSSEAPYSRGWIWEATAATPNTQTISVLKPSLNGEKQFRVLNLNSNKEYAISVRPAGTTLETDWIPEHGNTGTVFAKSQEFWVDNTQISDWTADDEMKTAKSVKVVQNMNGYHSSDLTNPLVEITTIHTFNAEGVSIQGKITFLRDTLCGSGYVMMFPVYPDFAKKLITNTGEVYDTTRTDNSNTNLEKEPTSFAYVNEGGTKGEPNVVAAMTVNDPIHTYRKGKEGRRDPFLFINHRDTTIQKLYPMIFAGYTASAGEEIKFGGTFHIGEMLMASKLLS